MIALGTKNEPGVGTGSFRYPVENVGISCEWGCYYGHRGTDFIDQYNSWGDVYAADNGVIEEVGYNGISGIGHIGMTGLATGPHVHMYFKVDGERHNACEFYDCESVPHV